MSESNSPEETKEQRTERKENRRRRVGRTVAKQDLVKFNKIFEPRINKTRFDSDVGPLLQIEYTECGHVIRWAGAQILALLSVYGLVMAGWWNVVTAIGCDFQWVAASSFIASVIAFGIGVQAVHAHNYWLLAHWRAAEIEIDNGLGLARVALHYRKKTFASAAPTDLAMRVYSKSIFPFLILAIHLLAVFLVCYLAYTGSGSAHCILHR